MISSILFIRISSIVSIYIGDRLLSFYIQSIGLGISIYSGLFQASQILGCINLIRKTIYGFLTGFLVLSILYIVADGNLYSDNNGENIYHFSFNPLIPVNKLLNTIISLLTIFNNYIYRTIDYGKVDIININYDKNTRYYIFIFNKVSLLKHEDALKAIYSSLMNNTEFKDLLFSKVLITSIYINGLELNLHPNISINNNTGIEGPAP